ncbi:MAG: DUF21 domain-containing protein, partial [Desulfobulbaceae bacterium]|nr:DUF21 domain-containing protein [Desulfobulbaceae bacterium]
MLIVLILAVTSAILISATCSVFEAALYTLSASHIELMEKKNPQQATILKKLKNNIEQPITAILTLNTIANTIGASVAGAATVAVFGPSSLLWFSLLFTLAILLFSEILPKTVGVIYARQLAEYISMPIQWMVFTLKPVIQLCQAVTRLIPDSAGANQISPEELRTIAKMSRKSGEIEKEQELVIANILQLGQKSVRQVMTPRTVTFSQDKNLTVTEAIQFADQWEMHSRVPVYDNDKDNVSGIVLTKDVFMAAASKEKNSIKLEQIMRPVHF